MTLTDSEIIDLGRGTLKNLGKLKFNQIATRLQNYEVMGRIMKKDRVQFDSGNGIQRNVVVDHSGAAKNVGLYEEDTVDVVDVLAQADIPWRHTTTHYAWERREMLVNRGESKIVDLMKIRRFAGMLSLAERMEADFWSKPASSSDKIMPYGVKYWVVANATEGHNGGDPSGFTAGAGNLDTTTYPRWKNYTGTYVNVSKDDLIKMMRTGYRRIKFKSPIDVPDYRSGNGSRFRIYCNETTFDAFGVLGEAQNENLGRDVAEYDGNMTFKRNQIVWVPALDSDTTDPVYMLDWETFYPVILKGDYLRETDPEKADGKHNVFVVFVDLTWNVMCDNRRCNAVFTK